MAVSDKTRRALAELGLDHETRAYITLVTYGALTASQISKNVAVPYSKIYDVLSSLEGKGWVETESSRPKRYYPKPPPEAMDTVRLRVESTMRDSEKQILSELQPLYEKKEVRERPDIWIIRGEFNVLAKLQETVGRTKNELMIATPTVSSALTAMFTGILLHLKSAGIKTMIMTTKTVEKELLRKLSEVAEVRIRDNMFGGGIISDEKEVLLILGEEEKPVLAIWSDHIGLAKFARDYFEYLWKDSLRFK